MADPTMPPVDVSRDRVETLPLTENLRNLLETAKSDILNSVKATSANPITTIPTPAGGELVVDEFHKSYYLKMERGSRLHTILDPQKLPDQSVLVLFVVQEGICHIPVESSLVIMPFLKIGKLDTRIVTAPADVDDVMVEPDGTLIAVAGKARMRSYGEGKLAYFAIGYKALPKTS